ncbi:hypothetical protein K490DRAFT_60792 [Saccharata proteae CBS 121410]|uniref:Uncharacterized protein n=1 Tax=Saccharata proteae CBS 121410 TaxID=1314787 RepID=A0A9P4I0N9_9PEZI|nr:hypothetical protein K490DRAFT_60792 [Saccharata proteae CBS 121410]
MTEMTDLSLSSLPLDSDTESVAAAPSDQRDKRFRPGKDTTGRVHSPLSIKDDESIETSHDNEFSDADGSSYSDVSKDLDPAPKSGTLPADLLRHDLQSRLSQYSTDIAAGLNGVSHSRLLAFKTAIETCHDVELFIALAKVEMERRKWLDYATLKEISSKGGICLELMDLFDNDMLHELKLPESLPINNSQGLGLLIKLRKLIGSAEVFMELLQKSRPILPDGATEPVTPSILIEISVRYDYNEQLKLLETPPKGEEDDVKARSLGWESPE